jgi:hypothetical protein
MGPILRARMTARFTDVSLISRPAGCGHISPTIGARGGAA